MFTKGKTPEAPPPPVAPKPIATDSLAARRPLAAASRSGPSIISADMKIIGGISSQGEVEIFGQVDGDVARHRADLPAGVEDPGRVDAVGPRARGL